MSTAETQQTIVMMPNKWLFFIKLCSWLTTWGIVVISICSTCSLLFPVTWVSQ